MGPRIASAVVPAGVTTRWVQVSGGFWGVWGSGLLEGVGCRGGGCRLIDRIPVENQAT